MKARKLVATHSDVFAELRVLKKERIPSTTQDISSSIRKGDMGRLSTSLANFSAIGNLKLA